ncbi:MAG TPA: hypothetical protein VNA11_00130 [Pseudonocardia sp.]|nr:hypothetical protein [Pseudonocardia sp.]
MVEPHPGSPHFVDPDQVRTVVLPVERRRLRGLWPALAAAAIIIGAGTGGAWMVWRPDAAPQTDPGAAPAPVGAFPSRAPAPTTAAPDPVPRSLSEQAVADRRTVARLVGRWVPQISSKAPGLVVDGVAYDEARIWAEFRDSRATYPDVALVRSGDYRSFTQRGHWVTILARAFADADAVNEWCDRQGFAPDDCFAKRLSHTDGARGNTVLRR